MSIQNEEIDVKIKLNNKENYLNDINYDIIFDKYISLLIQYTFFINTNEELLKNKNIYFIYEKGLELINNIFCIIILYTKNIDLAYYNVQKSYYFYVEFINQIEQIQLTDLKLTCNDAILFVFKKTIYEIDNDVKKNIIITNDNIYINLKNSIININKKILDLVCINNIFENTQNINKIEKELKKIYKNIKNNSYSFTEDN